MNSPTLDAINKANCEIYCHGHQCYLWWARRPLAATRAVIFAQMVDDPSTYVDQLRNNKQLMRKAKSLLKTRQKAWKKAKETALLAASHNISTPDPGPEPNLDQILAELERERLFKIIEDLVKWENTNNEEVLQKLVMKSGNPWRRTCAEYADHPRARGVDRHKLPAFRDHLPGADPYLWRRSAWGLKHMP